MKTRSRRDQRRQHVRALGWLLWVVCLAPSVSLASSGAASCDEDSACRPVVSRAREFSKAGQLDDALISYQAAYRITPDPRIVFNIARIQHKQNKLEDAKESYQRFIDTKFDDENLRSKAQEYIAAIQATLATQVTEPPPAGTLTDAATKGQASDPAQANKPVYKKAWFWVLIGGVAAAGIAGGIAAGVIVSQQPPAAPEGVPTFHLFK